MFQITPTSEQSLLQFFEGVWSRSKLKKSIHIFLMFTSCNPSKLPHQGHEDTWESLLYPPALWSVYISSILDKNLRGKRCWFVHHWTKSVSHHNNSEEDGRERCPFYKSCCICSWELRNWNRRRQSTCNPSCQEQFHWQLDNKHGRKNGNLHHLSVLNLSTTTQDSLPFTEMQ